MPSSGATASAFDLGWQTGTRLGEERRERQEALEDEERRARVADLYTKRNALATMIPSLTTGSDDYRQAMDGLTDIESRISAIYHPATGPGNLQKDWEFLKGLVWRKKPTPADLLSKTTEAGTPEQSMVMDGQTVTMPATEPYQVVAPRPAAMTKAQRQRMANREQARQAAEQDVLAAGLTPEQEASAGVRKLEGTMQALDKFMGPDWNPAERERTRLSLMQAALGTSGKEKYFSQIISTKDASGQEHYYRVPMQENAEPEEIDFSGQKMVPKTTAKPKGLRYDPLTGQVVDQDTARRYSLDDVGKPGAPPELLAIFNGARAMMDKKQQNALALANQRGLSLAQNRYGSFIDPANPTEVIPVPFGEAAKRGLHLAMGPKYLAMSRMLTAATSGPIGNEVVAYSAALQHADLLEQAAKNLNNPDTRVLAKIANDLATQFGDENPTDFNVIANAYTREVTKALTSGHVTDNELRENGATIPRDASPQQIMGAVAAYKNLMQSKIKIRTDQIAAGMAGSPYLGAQPAPTGGAAPKGGTIPAAAGAAGSKGGRSIAAAMKYWAGHPQKAQASFGTPRPSEQQVIEDIQNHGYTPTRP